VIGSFYIGNDLMLNLEVTVKAGTQLDGMTTAQLEEDDASVLAHTDGNTGQRRLHPRREVTIRPGDTIVIAVGPDCLQRLQAMTVPG